MKGRRRGGRRRGEEEGDERAEDGGGVGEVGEVKVKEEEGRVLWLGFQEILKVETLVEKRV